MRIKKDYSDEEVLDMLEEWRTENFEPNYKTIAERIGTTYTYFIGWKNGDRVVSKEYLQKIVDFIDNN